MLGHPLDQLQGDGHVMGSVQDGLPHLSRGFEAGRYDLGTTACSLHNARHLTHQGYAIVTEVHGAVDVLILTNSIPHFAVVDNRAEY